MSLIDLAAFGFVQHRNKLPLLVQQSQLAVNVSSHSVDTHCGFFITKIWKDCLEAEKNEKKF